MRESLTQQEFNRAAQQFSSTQNVITKAWKSTLDLTRFMNPNQGLASAWYKSNYPRKVDFPTVVEGIRFMETGQHHYLYIGRIAWNTLAEINNQDIQVYAPGFIIPWTDHIHPDFRNGEFRRERAAEHLRLAYEELGNLAIHS